MSEVNFKDIDNKLFRLEAEFYQSKYTDLDNIIQSFEKLGSISKRIECGPFGSNLLDTEYLDEGVLVVRPFNLKNSTVEKDNLVYISEKLVKENSLKIYPINTLLFSRVGDIKVGVLNQKNSTISPNIIAVEFNDADFSKFFAIFFKTKYGFLQLERQLKIAAQPTISTGIIKDLKVPLLDNYPMVVKLFDDSQNNLKQSQQKYAEAETLLLENLGLQNFQANSEPVNIKSLKESFLKTGRLDAEFYQSKYDELENLFNRFERIKLADLVNYPISSGITPKANGDDYADKESGIAFIRAVDLQNGEVSLANLNYIKPSIHETTLKRTQLKQNDVLLSIAGTVGRCALFSHNMQANINQAVAILRFDESKVNRLYLVAFFNSELGKQFIAKYARQGLQTNLNLTEIGELSIPIPDMTIQIQIANYIQQSNDLREQATQLLAQAKHTVESEIENNSQLERRERERDF